MTPAIDTEIMSPIFTKFHLRNLPVDAVLHRFTAPDEGDPHDHPWSFQSVILAGGYIERIWNIRTGQSWLHEHVPGDMFTVPAQRVHRIVQLLGKECWTLVLPHPGPTRTSRFWQFREDGAWSRAWNEAEWTKA